MNKCPICNGCTEHRWVGNLHFWYCDFCKKYFKYDENHKMVEVDPKKELVNEWTS